MEGVTAGFILYPYQLSMLQSDRFAVLNHYVSTVHHEVVVSIRTFTVAKFKGLV